MGEDPAAPNYDPQHKLIRSMINGSRGPLLRKATALDWVGDPFDATGFVALHGESTFEQFLEHYQEYTDVVGDHFLNLVATTLPTNAYLVTGDAKYRRWIVDYMDAWLARMKQNGGIIPSFVDLDGRDRRRRGRWWGNAYGWGFSPVNPVTGRREDRNRIPRALVGFSNALLVTGDRSTSTPGATMIDAGQPHARVDGRKQYPTMLRRRRLVRLAARARGAWARSRSGAGRCAPRIARGSARTRGSSSSRAGTRLSGDGAAARSRTIRASGSRRSAPIARRPTSASPTTCSTPTRRRPTRWCG